MANDVGRAMARLKHKDIRTRRRAIRTLFEANDPSTLEAFNSLLDDEDPWFVSKALDAYRMWAVSSGPEAVSALLNHDSIDVRRAGANLLDPLGVNGFSLAKRALSDEDTVVLKKAAMALLNEHTESTANLLLDHEHETVRLFGFQHTSMNHDRILDGLKDANHAVRNGALRQVLSRGIDVDLATLLPFFEAGVEPVNILIWASKHAPDEISTFAQQLNAQHAKDITDHLRNQVTSSQDPLITCLLEAKLTEPVARWILHQGKNEDELRWKLINDNDVPLIERSKLLERLIGRANEPDVQENVKAMLDSTEEELLRVACENLSTAADELSS